MRSTTTNPLATWAVLVVWMALALLPAGGVSVCFGANGHIGVDKLSAEIGVAASVCPCGFPQQRGERAGAVGMPGEHPRCTDLAFELPEFCAGLNASNNNSDGADDPVWAPQTVGVALFVVLTQDLPAWRFPPVESVPSLALRQRSTVVLLI